MPPLWGRRPIAAALRRPSLAPWSASVFVVVWALWAMAFNSAQFGDNVEQFNWSHSLEWGYHKHPPLPTWLLGGLLRLLGPSPHAAYWLATLCALATAWLTWSIARELLGERVAAASVVLWSLHQCFSSRVQLYNHNTVLVVAIAATVWCTLRATRGATGWWIAAGLAAAAAILSKYQALLPLGGLLAALVWTRRLDLPQQRRGLLLAIGIALAACAPHVVWVASHRFTTLHYAAEAVQNGGIAERAWVLVSFAANQLRMVSPALAAVAVCLGMTRLVTGRACVAARPAQRLPEYASIWFWCLLGGPLLALVVLALAGGVGLRNHWGVQTMQFFGLWLAAVWQRREPIALRRLVGVAIVLHAVGLGIYAWEQSDSEAMSESRRMDTMYPAQRLADAALADWHAVTACPLRYVAGDPFEAGLVSMYSGGFPAVYESDTTTPWIDRSDLLRRGAVHVLNDRRPPPAGAASIREISLAPLDRPQPQARRVTLVVIAPAASCG